MLQQQNQRRKLQKQQQGRFCRLRTANAAAELASLMADVRRRSSSSGNTYRTSSKHEIYACAPRNAQNGGATKTIHSRNSHLRQKEKKRKGNAGGRKLRNKKGQASLYQEVQEIRGAPAEAKGHQEDPTGRQQQQGEQSQGNDEQKRCGKHNEQHGHEET